MRVVCAPNAFKGSLGAAAAAAAMASGVRDAGGEAVEVPVADGGDGTLDVLLAASAGSRVEEVAVRGPLGAPVRARLGWLGDGTAVVEMAEAAGLRLVAAGSLDAVRASTYGVGELVRAALDGGARRIVVGVGGSATTDGGAGLCVALGARLLSDSGSALPPGGGALLDLARADLGGLDPRLRSTPISVAVDVRNPLLGPRGAAPVFAPQKGATPAQVALLDAALQRWATVLAAHPALAERPGMGAAGGTTTDLAAHADQAVMGAAGGTTSDLPAAPPFAERPGMGAAGGTAFGLAAVCGASLVPGAALICDLAGLDAALRDAELVLTGEGRLDSSTAEGKAPAEVARRAAAAGIPCVALAGSVEPPADPLYAAAVPISAGLPLPEALARTAALLRTHAAEVVRRWTG